MATVLHYKDRRTSPQSSKPSALLGYWDPVVATKCQCGTRYSVNGEASGKRRRPMMGNEGGKGENLGSPDDVAIEE